MNILVTGGAGFIGGHTADALLAQGHFVRILDNLGEPVHLRGKPAYCPPGAELLVGDVRSKADWDMALEGIDAVYHLAAYQDSLTDFSKFFHVNTVGTSLLYEVAVAKQLPLKKVIIASSQAVYGEGKYRSLEGEIVYPDMRAKTALASAQWEIKSNNSPLTPQWTDEEIVKPQNQYAISKYTQELVGLNLGRRYEIPTVCLRYSIVQGPRQSLYNAYSGVCRIFSQSYLFGKQPIVFEDGHQIRDYVNIEDVVRANLLVLEEERANFRSLNVGGGRPYSVLEFAEIVARAFNATFEPELTGEFRFGDTRHIMSDVTNLRELGWSVCNDAEYSVRTYREWLLTQEATAETVEYAYKHMRDANVLGKSRKAVQRS